MLNGTNTTKPNILKITNATKLKKMLTEIKATKPKNAGIIKYK